MEVLSLLWFAHVRMSVKPRAGGEAQLEDFRRAQDLHLLSQGAGA